MMIIVASFLVLVNGRGPVTPMPTPQIGTPLNQSVVNSVLMDKCQRKNVRCKLSNGVVTLQPGARP